MPAVLQVIAPLSEHMEVDVFAISFVGTQTQSREALQQELAALYPTDFEIYDEAELDTKSPSMQWYELEHVNRWGGAAVQAAARQWFGWSR